jgi:tetratricopeptide (TPR) repeat protein
MRSWALIFSLFVALANMLALKQVAFCLTSQDVPPADLPTANPTLGLASSPTPGPLPSPAYLEAHPASNSIIPEPAAETAAQDEVNGEDSVKTEAGSPDSADEQSGVAAESPAATAPALDASAVTVMPELGNESLEAEINKTAAPALAASLRLTESARKRLGDGQVDDAMRELARAVSLDPSDAFAYYYLGRAYLARRNYTQALTFFRRAEIGFNGRSDWTAEALSYEGLCDEELGRTTDAVEAYKRALAAAPNNFRARIGYGRLAGVAGPVENIDAPPPAQDLAIPPPNSPDESAPAEQPPQPPPE